MLNVPAGLAAGFPGRTLVLRTADPAAVPGLLGPEMSERIAFLQVLSAAQDLTPLTDWAPGLPVDLLLLDPVAELPWIYRAVPLFDRHPVRVTVPLVPGLARAVRLALSLGFPVRLAGYQPGAAALAEAAQALGEYLHNPAVAQPLEPFHGLLGALVHDAGTGPSPGPGPGPEAPVRLWELMECDPAQFRVLDESGAPVPGVAPDDLADFRAGLLAGGAECVGCPWFASCEGYFKWPRPDYDCTGVKGLFAGLAEAAAELRAGLDEYERRRA